MRDKKSAICRVLFAIFSTDKLFRYQFGPCHNMQPSFELELSSLNHFGIVFALEQRHLRLQRWPGWKKICLTRQLHLLIAIRVMSRNGISWLQCFATNHTFFARWHFDVGFLKVELSINLAWFFHLQNWKLVVVKKMLIPEMNNDTLKMV